MTKKKTTNTINTIKEIKSLMSTKKNKKVDWTLNEVITTPWGSYEYIYVNLPKGIVIKKLTINEGHRFSLQRHTNRTEYWNVLNNNSKFMITIQGYPDSMVITQPSKEPIIVYPTKLHRAECFKGSLEIIETSIFYPTMYSSLNHFESDIERHHDDYGRK